MPLAAAILGAIFTAALTALGAAFFIGVLGFGVWTRGRRGLRDRCVLGAAASRVKSFFYLQVHARRPQRCHVSQLGDGKFFVLELYLPQDRQPVIDRG